MSELYFDINFIEEQLKSDLGSYSLKDLERANEKISILKRKAEIFGIELDRKRNSKNESDN
ncbi:MAG: hypothetical protein ACHQ1H_10350 [Nitrososphaerales archaeon]